MVKTDNCKDLKYEIVESVITLFCFSFNQNKE